MTNNLKWWNDKNIEVVEIENNYIALDGWNGEKWTDCFEVADRHGDAFYEMVRDGLEVQPVYTENSDGDFEISGYEFC